MLERITCATPGSWRDGNRTLGIQALISGRASSSEEKTAPAIPKITAITSGRMRKPPRSAYIAERRRTGRRSNICVGHRRRGRRARGYSSTCPPSSMTRFGGM